MWKRVFVLLIIMSFPAFLFAQNEVASDIQSLHSVLDRLFDEMLPMCESLISVAIGLGGFGALWFIAVRVWGHLARAEPIDFYPLFKPFAIGFAILNFNLTIACINGIMKPIVTGTSSLVTETDQAIVELLKQKEDAIKTTDPYKMYVGDDGKGDYDKWYKYTHPDDEDDSGGGLFDGIGNSISFQLHKMGYNLRNQIKAMLSEVLQILFAAASLCINTLRTFNLIILAILGPLAFGFSMYDGFSHSLRHWLSRYINVFLWLPIANIFGAVIGKIQVNMLKLDISQINDTSETFFSPTDMGYLIFMIIGIIGYFTVPSIANYVVFVGGGDAITSKSSALAGAAVGGAVGAGMAGAGMAAGQVMKGGSELGDQLEKVGGSFKNLGLAAKEGYDKGPSSGSSAYNAGKALGKGGAFLHNKLSGNSGDGG